MKGVPDLEWLTAAIVRHLTQRQRIALVLYLFTARRQKDIAALLGVHESRVGHLLRSAAHRLRREWLKREGA